MKFEFKKKLIKNFSLIIYELRKIREIEDNERYQLERMADELNAIRFTLEEINKKL